MSLKQRSELERLNDNWHVVIQKIIGWDAQRLADDEAIKHFLLEFVLT